ncbi:hypothetical protein D3C73_858060 [compost metagenome]
MEPRGYTAAQQAGTLQLFQSRQITQFLDTEMIEKIGCGPERDRATGRSPATAKTNPAGLHQHVQRTFGGLNATDILDLRAGDRLMIGYDRQHFERCTRQLSDLVIILADNEGKIGSRAEGPAICHADKIDAPAGIVFCKSAQKRRDIRSARQSIDQKSLRNRLGRSKDQCLGDALGFEVRKSPAMTVIHIVTSVRKGFDSVGSGRHSPPPGNWADRCRLPPRR